MPFYFPFFILCNFLVALPLVLETVYLFWNTNITKRLMHVASFHGIAFVLIPTIVYSVLRFRFLKTQIEATGKVPVIWEVAAKSFLGVSLVNFALLFLNIVLLLLTAALVNYLRFRNTENGFWYLGYMMMEFPINNVILVFGIPPVIFALTWFGMQYVHYRCWMGLILPGV